MFSLNVLFPQIFPVHLKYDQVERNVYKISESLYSEICSERDTPEVYNCVMEWLNVFCWPFFLRLIKKRIACIDVHNIMSTRHWPQYFTTIPIGHSCTANIVCAVPFREGGQLQAIVSITT